MKQRIELATYGLACIVAAGAIIYFGFLSPGTARTGNGRLQHTTCNCGTTDTTCTATATREVALLNQDATSGGDIWVEFDAAATANINSLLLGTGAVVTDVPLANISQIHCIATTAAKDLTILYVEP